MTTRTLPRRRSTTSAVPSREATHWEARAACRNTKPEVFFPPVVTAATLARAERVCARCPVQMQCLTLADSISAESGVWGGVDRAESAPKERVKRSYGSAHLPAVLDIIVTRRSEFEAAVARGLTVHEIAKQFGTSPQTVYNVITALESGEVGWENEAANAEVVRQYLAGEIAEVHPRERLAAIVQGVQSGMTYKAFDDLHGLPKQSTETFIRRARKLFAAAGVEFPEVCRAGRARALGDAQVVEMREQRAAGVSADVLAERFGVAPGTVRDAVAGRTYQSAGGPLHQVRARSAPVERRQDEMEAAA